MFCLIFALLTPHAWLRCSHGCHTPFNACNLAWEHVVEGEGNLVPQSFMTGM